MTILKDSLKPEPAVDDNRNIMVRPMWLPVPGLLVSILILYVSDRQTVYEAPLLLLMLNFVFTTLSSVLVTILVTRSFVMRPSPGLLMVGCGALFWGCAGTVATPLLSYGQNVMISIHNILFGFAGLCHLIGVVASCKPGLTVSRPGRTAGAAFAATIAIVWLVTVVALNGWLPVFFIPGHGGTMLRQLVLMVTLLLFAGAALLLWQTNRRKLTPFVRWYSLALALTATGVFGVLLQSSAGTLLGWTGRAAFLLSGVYMFAASLATMRESGGYIALDTAKLDERLLLLLAPRRLTALPAIWRYALAMVCVVIVTALRVALIPLSGAVAPYNFAYLATVVTAMTLGIGPAVLTLVSASVAVEVFVLGAWPELVTIESLVRFGFTIGIGMFSVLALHGARVAARKARQSETRLASFVAATFEGIVESENGRIVDCNEQLGELLGYPVSELKGESIADLIAPADRDRVQANIDANRDSVIEHEMVRKDGSHIFVEAHGRSSTSGSMRRLTAIRDITARKQAELKLSETHRQMQDLIDNTTANVYACDLEERFVLANAALATLLKTTPAQMIGKRRHEFMPQADADAHEAADRQVIAAGQAVVIEEQSDLHGRSITWLSTKFPLRDAQGRIYAVAGIVTDITERKQAEMELRTSEERLRLTLQASEVGTFEIDLTTGAGQWNTIEYELLGLKPSDELVSADTFFRFVHPEDVAGLKAQWEEATRTGRLDVEFRIIRADGQHRWLAGKGEFAFANTADEGGGGGAKMPLRFLGVNYDITPRKQAEAALQRHALELAEANEDLARYNRAAVGREQRMIELKKEVNALLAAAGKPVHYALNFEEEQW